MWNTNEPHPTNPLIIAITNSIKPLIYNFSSLINYLIARLFRNLIIGFPSMSNQSTLTFVVYIDCVDHK